MSDFGEMSDARSGARGGRAARLYYGKYAGIVSDNAAPSSGAHRGQIKVKVPGILEETPDGGGSQPIEVLAAPSFLPGFFFVPENNSQVWVEFVAGDINVPIWTGVWYPNDAAPNDSDGSAPDEHMKVVRTPSGQVLHLSDTSGSEKLVLKDEKNKNTVTMDSSGVTIKCEQSSGTSTITMDSNGVTITFGQSTVSIQNGAIELKQGAMVSAKLDGAGGVAIAGGPSGVTVTDGTGAAQPVVLASLLNWLQTHQHIGNMGAPTPLFPGDIATLTALKPTLVSKLG